MLLASLTLVIFWLPPESPAKMVLGKQAQCKLFMVKMFIPLSNTLSYAEVDKPQANSQNKASEIFRSYMRNPAEMRYFEKLNFI